MERFEHGGNIYKQAKALNSQEEDIIDFSANINPLGIPASFKRVLIQQLECIVNYPDPDYTALVQSIADYEKVRREEIIVGNGATEVIYEIIETLKPKKSLVGVPTFSEYERALKRINCDVEYFYLKEEVDFQIDESFLKKIDESIDLIILCNPNNPTSQLIDRGILREVLERCRENAISLMIDEAFIDFVKDGKKETLIPYINNYKNLYIIRSLTKFFAVPGLRIGYGISSNKDILRKIVETKQPWTINSFAALAGEIVLKDSTYIEESIAWISKEREYLYQELKEIKGIKVFPPQGNYILFKVLDGKKSIISYMLKYKILIRGCSNYRNLTDAFYRVAIKDRKNNNLLVNRLKEALYED